MRIIGSGAEVAGRIFEVDRVSTSKVQALSGMSLGSLCVR